MLKACEAVIKDTRTTFLNNAKGTKEVSRVAFFFLDDSYHKLQKTGRMSGQKWFMFLEQRGCFWYVLSATYRPDFTLRFIRS